MSFVAMMISAVMDLSAPAERVLACTFPSADESRRPISVKVEALPSLRDADGIFRIRLSLESAGAFRGMAQPIERTTDRDVLIRAEAGEGTFYTIGLRDDGRAALNLLRADPSEYRETRAGTCRDPQNVLDTWLTS
jgi:hypothetical protein